MKLRVLTRDNLVYEGFGITEMILVGEWKCRILRSFGNEIKSAGITTRLLPVPILQERFVAFMYRMLHFDKAS